MPASIDALRRVLLVPRVLGVTTAYFAFIAAENGTWVAILVYAYAATGPLSVGLVAVAQLLPAALIAPFAVTIGQHVARDRALAASYALLAITLGATGVAMLSGATPLLVYLLAIIAQCALTPVRPLQAAIAPVLVGTAEALTAANALSMVLEGVGGLAGPLAAGLILLVAPPGAAFLVAAVACVGGFVLVTGVALTTHHTAAPVGVHAPSPPRERTGALDGIRSVRASRSGMLVIGLIGARQVIAGALDVLLVIAAIELLRMGEAGAGYLSAALGFGAVIGGASTLALAGRQHVAPFLLLGAIFWGLFIVLIAVGQSPGPALVFLVGAGIGLAVLQVSARTLLQRLMPVDAVAGAFGVLEAFIFGGLAVGALVAGPLVAFLGLAPSIVVLGLVMPIVAGLVLPTVIRGERTISVPLREIALLRRLRLFAPVPAPALESAARRLTAVTARPGEVIIREGAVGDRFYVVVEGTVEVSRGARPLRTLGPGEAFGEIALLRRVPRTATVTAIDGAELRALERDDFLLAITGTPQALDEASRVADAHLDRDATLESAGI